MSIQSRNSLKAQFVSGTAATQDKFEDVFDSHYNRYEDSVVMGPVGVTGSNGLWYLELGATPATLSSPGTTGQVSVNESGIWICYEANTWVKIATSPLVEAPGSTSSLGSTGNFATDSGNFYFHDGSQWWVVGGTSF